MHSDSPPVTGLFRARVLGRFLTGASIGLFLIIVLDATRAQDGQPSIRTVSQVVVRVSLIGVRPDGTEPLASGTIQTAPDRPGSAVFPIDFRTPAGDRVTELRLSLEGSSSEDGVLLSVTTDVLAAMPRQEPVSIRRVREAKVSAGGTFLHQVYESPDHESSLVLTISLEARDVPVFVRPTAGEPILFRVVMSRITDKGAVDLENNILRTLGENPVSYSFKTVLEAAGDSAPIDGSVSGEGSPLPAAESPGARAQAGPPPTSSPPAGSGTVPSPPTTVPAPHADSQGEEIELTLAPRRPSEGILVIEATLKRRLGAAVGAPADRSEIVRKTGVVSRGGVMEILVGGNGEQALGAYRFRILADF